MVKEVCTVDPWEYARCEEAMLLFHMTLDLVNRFVLVDVQCCDDMSEIFPLLRRRNLLRGRRYRRPGRGACHGSTGIWESISDEHRDITTVNVASLCWYIRDVGV